jgi:polysaccharide deacetylase family protein (PEP-CTERM system associated)
MKNKQSVGSHIVTVLLHDYFHRGVFKQVVGEKQWSRFESRLDQNVDAALELLRSFNIKGTFFTLGWIADKDPAIIKRIVAEGHEIADAGYSARSISEMTPDQFRDDLRRSRRALENAGANTIIGFRSAYKWLDKKHFWALDILRKEGYLYDASYKPAFINPNRRFAFEYKTASGTLHEFPTATHSFFGVCVPISGGSYLRLLPHPVMYHYFSNWNKNIPAPFVLYFHPWELDRTQPMINAVGKFAKIRQYGNLGKMKRILPRYFREGKFQSVNQYLGIGLKFPERKHGAGPGDPPFTGLCEEGGPNVNIETLTRVSVAIPCYNESDSIPYLTKAIEELQCAAKNRYRLSFIFVDDRSSDNTVEILRKTFGGRDDCKIVEHKKNKGVAGALISGITAAETEIVCTIDADCSYDPLELLKMVPLLEQNNADMVTASPYHKNGFVLGVPGWRLFLSRSLSNIYHFVLHHRLATYTSCFRVCRRSAALKAGGRHDDFRGVVELLARIDLQGGKIVEYPTTLHSRIFGFSKMKVLKTIAGHLGLLIEIYRLRKASKRSSTVTPEKE